MTGAAIEVQALSMRYPKVPSFRDLLVRPFHRDYVQALDGVTLAVPPGILYGFLGPNGAGKTTLIKILTTLILPTSGHATVGGFDVTRSPDSVKRRIGVVMSDERSFYWRLTGRQNLMFFAALHGLSGRTASTRIAELLELLGMSGKADQRFSDYSSGMKQKVAIARGLLPGPEILFFDEPTRSLDPISAAQIRGFVRERLVEREGKTVFLTTHNLYEAEEISDQVGIISRGRILATGTVSEISARLRRREHYRLLLERAPAGLDEALRGVEGVAELVRQEDGRAGTAAAFDVAITDAGRAVPELIQVSIARGARVLECARRESSLGEIFSEIVGEDARHDDAA